ncbi:MAG: N6-adenine-specific methylase [Thermotogales bacterium 46_20]|nr:MAG: N6-adenine-specific methylase [Thermotogales bacterium 46_20]
MLTITGGRFKGRHVRTLSSHKTRYTPALARRAFFDMIDITGRTFLDLFAGSGIMSLEALSRQASLAVPVEVSRSACSVIKSNRDSLGIASDEIRIVCTDFRRALKSFATSSQSFDVIFADPPFEKGFFSDLVKNFGKFVDYLRDSLIVIETSGEYLAEFTTCLESSDFVLTRNKSYSGVNLVFLEVRRDET